MYCEMILYVLSITCVFTSLFHHTLNNTMRWAVKTSTKLQTLNYYFNKLLITVIIIGLDGSQITVRRRNKFDV